MKTQKSSISTAPLFLEPRHYIEMYGQGHAPAFLPCDRESVSIAQESVWVAVSVWKGAEYFAPTGFRSSDPPLRSKSLYRLLYPEPPNCTDIKEDTQSVYNLT